MASAGCRKNAAVPVLVSVAAIFRQMRPDLPMPVTMTRPRQPSRRATARSKVASIRGTRARIAAASVSRTFRASARLGMRGPLVRTRLGPLRDSVERLEPQEERLEAVEAKRVLGVAPGMRRI